MNAMNTAPESKGRIMAFMVLFVALIEVVAIYGLIIAFKVLAPVETENMEKVNVDAKAEIVNNKVVDSNLISK
jgi:hypothetical protein